MHAIWRNVAIHRGGGYLKSIQKKSMEGRGEGWKDICIAKNKGRDTVEHNDIMYIYTWTPPYSTLSNYESACYKYVRCVVKTVVGTVVAQDFGSLLHLDMFNSHPYAKSEILFVYINKVPCFAFWASFTVPENIYNVLWMKTRFML